MPAIVQWARRFLAEMDVTIAAPILYNSNIHFVRSEWGLNANSHWHRLLYSEKLGRLYNQFKLEF